MKISNFILEQWCKKIPRGFPIIENGKFNKNDLKYLKEFLSKDNLDAISLAVETFNKMSTEEKEEYYDIDKKTKGMGKGETAFMVLLKRILGKDNVKSGGTTDPDIIINDSEYIDIKRPNESSEVITIPGGALNLANLNFINQINELKRAFNKHEDPLKYDSIKKIIAKINATKKAKTSFENWLKTNTKIEISKGLFSFIREFCKLIGSTEEVSNVIDYIKIRKNGRTQTFSASEISIDNDKLKAKIDDELKLEGKLFLDLRKLDVVNDPTKLNDEYITEE